MLRRLTATRASRVNYAVLRGVRRSQADSNIISLPDRPRKRPARRARRAGLSPGRHYSESATAGTADRASRRPTFPRNP
jgi:hypothetical protein